jgi:hypothetical protein
MQSKAPLVSLILVLCVGCFSVCHAQVVYNNLSPASGVPGATVSLFGSGFQGSVQVQLSGVSASVSLNTATQVNFTVPANAPSGFIAIQVGGVWYTNPFPFTVKRAIQGAFNPPPGISRAGYQLLAGGTLTNCNVGTGEFHAAVALEDVAVVWAFRAATEPAFLALVPPQTNAPVVDAASTAEALVLLNPAVNGRPLERYTNLVSQLHGLGEFTQLTARIASAANAGRDYLDDASAEAAWLGAVQALLALNPPAPALPTQSFFVPGTPSGTKLRYLNAPETSANGNGWRRLEVTIDGPEYPHPDDFKLSFASAGRFQPFENPLDWFISIYELDSTQFSNGLVSVGQLTSNSIPKKRFFLNTATVPATLFTKNFDLVDVAAGKIMDTFFAHGVDPYVLKPNENIIPALRPGVYVAEAYSGSLYYGTTLFANPPESQSQLITDLDGTPAWAVSLGGNVFVAAVDLVSGIGGLFETFKEFRAKSPGPEGEESVYLKILKGVAEDVVKSLAVHENQMASKDSFYDLVKSAASSLIKNITNEILDKPGSVGMEEYGTKVLKTVGKTLNVLSKLSTVAQGVERTTGLLDGRTLALERSAIVIGNPFAPSITRFLPLKGRGGEVLTIFGANFGSNTNELHVSFRQFASTADPSEATARMDLEILNATPTSIAVRVPWTNFSVTFPNLSAYVVVERGNTNFTGSSAALPPPNDKFRFLDPPTITSVAPDPVTAGAMLELRGLGFDNETAREYEVFIDGVSQSIGRMADVGGNRMGFVMPSVISTGLHNLNIRLRDKTNATFPFTVALPAYTKPSGVAAGWGIIAEIPDASNTPTDHKISVAEAVLIAKGQLGRAIEDHLPCEFLPPEDPDACPYQEREIDHVSNGGGTINSIIVLGDLTFSGPLPALSAGDNYTFGAAGHPFIVDGGGGGGAGLLFDGTSGTRLTGNLIVRNFSGHGIQLRNGASGNFLDGISIQNCGGDGFLLEGSATDNQIRNAGATNIAGSGIHLMGAGVQRNLISSTKGGVFPLTAYDIIAHCGNGIRLEGGANMNSVVPGTIRNCLGAGIYIGGASNNFVGRATEELARHYDLVNNQGPGAHLGPGAVGNVLRYLNPINNQGDGVLLEGPGCSNNIVDRTYAGVNLYEGGTSLTIPNQGSGIRLAGGAQNNLIGARHITIGEHGSISGNRDDGIRLEGAATAFNTVNAQYIGVLDPNLGVGSLKFSGNGLSGIALRDGAHDNMIGDQLNDLANAVFAEPQAGIELADNGTDGNLVLGNQIGSFFTKWVLTTGSPNRNWNGLWIHDGPRNNTIGLPGAQMLVPRFPGDPLGTFSQGWNAINSCSNTGILIENSGGTVGTDGVLAEANVIQANRIGELDNGNLAPQGEGTGIKLATGAEANVIGGERDELGNRVRGWLRACFWIDQNHLSSPLLRNRIENNYIEGAGTGVFLRYTNYLTATPDEAIGFLVSDSSGHTIGESQLTKNTIYVSRLGLYLGDSSSNVVRGFFITNCFNAGLTVRGGGGNIIGGDTANEGNRIHAFGVNNEPNWAGLAISQTLSNRIRANEIGFTAPGRGAVGLFVTNAFANEFGGAARFQGNIVISNTTNGIVLSGPNCAGNTFFNNRIGVDRDGKVMTNRGDGIRIEGGAHDNFIGGLAGVSSLVKGQWYSGLMPVGNIIANNRAAGVRVTGASTVGNRILYNSISANGDKGILHENGGNTLQPPPNSAAYDGKAISGAVASLAVTPAGSTIQLFCDPSGSDPEGDVFLGEGIVQANGTWRAVLTGSLLHSNLTATATDGGDGSTSEFGTGNLTLQLHFLVARTDAAASAAVPAGSSNAAVFRLSLSAITADVRVESLAFDTTGSLPDPTAVTAARLYHDTDGSGTVTPADTLLAGPVTYGADNGRITFAGMNPVIEANSTQRWVVAYSLAPGAPVGAMFQLTLTNVEAVTAKYLNPVNLEATPEGSFAIQSANHTVTGGTGNPGDSDNDGLPDWWERLFFGDLSRDGTGDFDGDGFSDFAELQLGTNPTDPASLLRIIPPPLVSPAGVTVVWKSVAGKLYRLQYRNAVGDPSWSEVSGDVLGADATAQKLDATTAGQPLRFYRVLLASSGDSDGDGLVDAWEQQYFGNLSRDGSGDFDNDGVSDAYESIAGTVPTNSVSVLKVLPNPVVTSGGATIQWASVAGKTYRLQFKNTLNAAAWQNVPGDVTATGGTASKTDSTASGQAQRYYRVVVVL